MYIPRDMWKIGEFDFVCALKLSVSSMLPCTPSIEFVGAAGVTLLPDMCRIFVAPFSSMHTATASIGGGGRHDAVFGIHH